MGQTVQHHHPQHQMINQPPTQSRGIFSVPVHTMTIPKEEPQLPQEHSTDLGNNWSHTQHGLEMHHISSAQQPMNIPLQINHDHLQQVNDILL